MYFTAALLRIKMEFRYATVPVAWSGPTVTRARKCEVGMCMDRYKEIRLIEEARGGSQDAFKQLVQNNQKKLEVYIKSWPGIQPVDAEEIGQEVWNDIWECIHRFPEDGGYNPAKGSFLTWVINYKAKQKILDRLKRLRSKQNKREIVGIPVGENGELIFEPQIQHNFGAEEERYLKVMAYRELFRLTFLCGGYPHEQLAFGFSKLVYGEKTEESKKRKDKKGEEVQEGTRGDVEGVPRKVDSEYGAEWLGALINHFWNSYQSVSAIDDLDTLRSLEGSLEPMRLRLKLKVRDLMKMKKQEKEEKEKNNPLRNHLEVIKEKPVAETCLRDYYARKDQKTHPISHWSVRIANTIRRVLGLVKGTSEDEVVEEITARLKNGPVEPISCNRCKLRHAPPCCAVKSRRGPLLEKEYRKSSM
jgi:DNA-directed RNA polymerase specialized sigma24 family protein